jgi:hypothetical protein
MAQELIFFIAGLAVGALSGAWFFGQWVYNEVGGQACEAMEKIVRRLRMHGFDEDYLRNAVNKSDFFTWPENQDKPEQDG